MPADFGNVKSEGGLQRLNEYMATHSYVEGESPSAHDAAVFSKLTMAPASKFSHAARWYRQIASYTPAERKQWSVGLSTPSANAAAKSEDDDFDLFGEETAEEASAAQAVKAAAKKPEGKQKKPIINKSQLVLEVKPADTETDLDELEKMIKQIKLEGLEWSVTCKKVPIAFGLMKLQIGCVIVDDVVNTDDILEKIEALGLDEQTAARRSAHRQAGNDDSDEEEYEGALVQSADIASFNKL